jgi:hypothetical protein
VPVAYIINLTYLGGRDQEDCGLKPAQGNSSQGPILKIPNTKKDRLKWQSTYLANKRPRVNTLVSSRKRKKKIFSCGIGKK